MQLVLLIFVVLVVALHGPAQAAQRRIFSAFAETADHEVIEAVASLLARELKDGEFSDINGQPYKVTPVYWVAPIAGDGRRTTFVQLWQSTWCGSAGCNTWILDRERGTWRVRVTEPFPSDEIAIEPATRNGHRLITNWNRLGCARILWTASAYNEGRYGNWSYCRR